MRWPVLRQKAEGQHSFSRRSVLTNVQDRPTLKTSTAVEEGEMSLRDRIDVFCAMIGIWGASILKYFDDIEASGMADFSGLLEVLEVAELSEALAWPLLALGVTGSGRVLWTTCRSIAGCRPPSRHYVRHF
jgi:hypothetical protein